MFRHHGTGSHRALQHQLPTEVGHITLPPLWTGTVLAHQPTGDPAPTGTTPPAGPPAPPAAPPAPSFDPAQQAYINQLVEDRLARDRAARPAAPPNLAELQTAAAELAQIKAAQGTDLERAAAEAKAAGTAAGRAELLPSLIAARIQAARPGLTDEAAAALVAPLNATYFLGPDGAVDPAKIAGYVGTLPAGTPGQPAAPAPGTTPPAQPFGWPSLGQGSTGAPPVVSPGAAGSAEADRRWGDQAGSFPLGRPIT